jgi:hypothetical protein
MARHLDIYPSPSDVLYVPPNADGSRKLCSNCSFYVSPDFRCLILPLDKFVGRHAVCGYHVYGTPLEKRPRSFHAVPLTPEQVGLISTWGTSCDRCAWYKAPEGKTAALCFGVYKDGQPLHVEPLACCTRWTKG